MIDTTQARGLSLHFPLLFSPIFIVPPLSRSSWTMPKGTDESALLSGTYISTSAVGKRLRGPGGACRRGYRRTIAPVSAHVSLKSRSHGSYFSFGERPTRRSNPIRGTPANRYVWWFDGPRNEEKSLLAILQSGCYRARRGHRRKETT